MEFSGDKNVTSEAFFKIKAFLFNFKISDVQHSVKL